MLLPSQPYCSAMLAFTVGCETSSIPFDARSGVMYLTVGSAATRFNVRPDMLYKAALISGNRASSVAPSEVTWFSRLELRGWLNWTMTLIDDSEPVCPCKSGESLELPPKASVQQSVRTSANRSHLMSVTPVTTSAPDATRETRISHFDSAR